MATIKNARSTAKSTFDVIQKTLADHKVKQIVFDYDGQGRIQAIEFALTIGGKIYPYRLPARVQNVEKILYPNAWSLTSAQKEQAYRTAWANIRDWIAAQCAMLDTGMVTPEEIFLPYMVSQSGQTFYEEMVKNQFLLPSGEERA